MRILVTGASDGIGRATATELARAGHAVVVHGRPGDKLDHATESVREAAGGETETGGVEQIAADLASLGEVSAMAREIAERFPDLQVAILNAGVMTRRRRESHDGIELTFAVNHLATMLLADRLVPVLRGNAPARIVVVSSMVHTSGRLDFDDLELRRGYDGMDAYCASKLANVYVTRVLSRRLDPAEITVNALHPGVIHTKLLHEYFSGGSPTERGAETSVYLATAPEVAGTTGAYFSDRRRAPSPAADDPDREEEANRLWDVSEQMIARALGDTP